MRAFYSIYIRTDCIFCAINKNWAVSQSEAARLGYVLYREKFTKTAGNIEAQSLFGLANYWNGGYNTNEKILY